MRLSQLSFEDQDAHAAERQLAFLACAAAENPTSHTMFLLTLMNRETPPPRGTVVLAEAADADGIPLSLLPNAAVTLLRQLVVKYPPKDGQNTFFICRDHSCPPVAGQPCDAYTSSMPEKLQAR